MSTRSTLIRKNPDNSYTTVYCHSDGYPTHNGYMALRHFNTPAKVDALFLYGDLSCIRGNVGRKHDFNDRVDKAPQRVNNWNTYYTRDRGEDTWPRTYTTWAEVLRHGITTDSEWVYLYKGGQWYFQPNDGNIRMRGFTRLTPEHTERRRTRYQTTELSSLVGPEHHLYSTLTYDGTYTLEVGWGTLAELDRVTFHRCFTTMGPEDTDWH